MKIFYLKIVILFMLNGCNAKEDMEVIINKNFRIIKSFPENIELAFTKIIDYNDGRPYKIFEVDSGLYIFDINTKGNQIFHFYSFALDGFTSSYIGKGSGPYEAFSPKSSGIIDGMLWVLDFTTHKVIENDLTNLNEKNWQKETKLVDFFNRIEILNENEIIANGLLGSHRKFQKLNRHSGEIISEFGDFERVPGIFTDEILDDFFQANFALKPDGSQLVSVYRWNEAIEIFDLEASESLLIRGPGNINNEFALKKDEFGMMVFERGGNIQKCYIDVFATDRFIYTLFSGNYDNVMDSQYSDTFYVYTWDGIPVTTIKVDRKIQSFSVSPDNSKIYSFDVDAGEVVYVSLDLPEFVDAGSR